MDLLEDVFPIENGPFFSGVLLVFNLESLDFFCSMFPFRGGEVDPRCVEFVVVFFRFGWNQDWQKGIKIDKKRLGQMFVWFLFFGNCFEKLFLAIAINHHHLNAFGFENTFSNPGTSKSKVFQGKSSKSSSEFEISNLNLHVEWPTLQKRILKRKRL